MEQEKEVTVVNLFRKDTVKTKFEEMLGKRSTAFITAVLQAVQSSEMLSKADPLSILNAAATAASLDLVINQNFGYAWIVPYNDKKSGKCLAQFQMGWKGYVQLALRTNQYSNIGVSEVYANQFTSFNRLTGELDADMTKPETGGVVGYASYFRMKNGFEKITFWSHEEVMKHAKKYSKSFGKGGGIGWNDPDSIPAMAMKTVLKNNLSKWGLMSVEMQTAQLADQAVIDGEGRYRYVDNEQERPDPADVARLEENSRALRYIAKAENVEELEVVLHSMPEMEPEVREIYDAKEKELVKKLNP